MKDGPRPNRIAWPLNCPHGLNACPDLLLRRYAGIARDQDIVGNSRRAAEYNNTVANLQGFVD
jgi:hypothetical protein